MKLRRRKVNMKITIKCSKNENREGLKTFYIVLFMYQFVNLPFPTHVLASGKYMIMKASG